MAREERLTQGEIVNENYPTAAKSIGGEVMRRPDCTLRQNLEDQIVQAEKRLQALREARDRLEKSGILDSRIEDIQTAMRW
jgi:hypothetical protein